MDKPTLHDIAAMPFPASQMAMRSYYNPEWGKPVAEGKTAYRVRLEWTASGVDEFEVEADSEEEAIKIARRDISNINLLGADDVSVERVEVLS